MRHLVTIQKIENITPIKGADRIETVQVLGWECVAKKGEFSAGEECVYFEIDSKLPDHIVFEFMRDRKFRVKTAKFRKQISQGLALPKSILSNFTETPLVKFKIGDDVTDIIGVTKHDPERAIENNARTKKKHGKIFKYCMRHKAFRLVYNKYFRTRKDNFPQFFPKTDEDRVQNMPHIAISNHGKTMVALEKLDGQSVSIFYNKELSVLKIFKKSNRFGVCSRNIWLKTKHNCNWWNIVDKYNIDKTLPNFCKLNNMNLVLQGEIVGTTIQKNKYKLDDMQLFIFRIYDIDKCRFISTDYAKLITSTLNLQFVPEIEKIPLDKDIHNVSWFVDYVTRRSIIGSKPVAEGVVFVEETDGNVHFKCINPKFLLKYKL